MKLKDEALLELSAAELNLVSGGCEGQHGKKHGKRILDWSKSREELHKDLDNYLDTAACPTERRERRRKWWR